MNKIVVTFFLIFSISCKTDMVSVPSNIKESKEFKAFIREFQPNTQVIIINENKYFINEVFLTHSIYHEKVYKNVTNVVFIIVDANNNETLFTENDGNYPIYDKFEIIVNNTKYDLGVHGELVSSIPINTTEFVLNYYDNKTKRVINFKAK